MIQNSYTVLYFIRHAESDLSVKDERTRPLTPKGQNDAQQLLHIFKHVTIDYMYSSPYTRAVETVKYLAESHKKRIVICEDLRERTVGRWVDDFFSFAQRQWKDFQYVLGHGESLQDVQNRNIAVVKNLLTQHQYATILIATHGTALGTIRNYYEQQFGFEQFWAMADKMPYIVKMMFEKSTLKSIEEVSCTPENDIHPVSGMSLRNSRNNPA